MPLIVHGHGRHCSQHCSRKRARYDDDVVAQHGGHTPEIGHPRHLDLASLNLDIDVMDT